VPEIGYFIAPDNGLLTYILEAYPNVTVREILNPNFMLQPVSPTFHGRDIFAPTAALLSKDNTWENIGESLNPSGLIRLPDLLPQWHDDGKKRTLEGFVIHIDHFGNLITNISQELFKPYNDKQLQKIEVIVPLTYHIKGIQKTYGEAKNNKVIALFGSSNYLEVAKVNGNAAFFAESQYVKLGKKVKVTVDY
jgi:S-adenosylmethionine hydrolase